MNKIILLLLTITTTGCTAVNWEETSPVEETSPNTVSVASDRNLTYIKHVYVSMTRKEVETVMGEALTIGYVKKGGRF